MENLRKQKLVRTQRVPDMPGRLETVFEPGAADVIRRQAVVVSLPDGTFAR